MTLFCAAIGRHSVPLLKFPFLATSTFFHVRCHLCHVMAHGDEEVGLILSSRIELEYQAVKK